MESDFELIVLLELYLLLEFIVMLGSLFSSYSFVFIPSSFNLDGV